MGRKSRSKKRRAKARGKQKDRRRKGPLSDLPGAPHLSTPLVRAVLTGRGLLVSLGLAAACIFIYAPVRNHQFLSWDDTGYVRDNIRVAAGLTSNGARWALNAGYMANWHPLTWLSHMLDVELFGVKAGPMLCVNVLFHVLNAVLLFGLLYKMTGYLRRSAFVAALFAVHPLHVESVAWLSERKDVLSTFLGLLTLWAYVEYARRPKRTRYFLVMFLFALGLTAKPMLVTLPFVMLLADYWPLRRVTPGKDSQFRRVALRLAWEKLPLLGIAAISSVVTYVAQQRAGAVSALARLPIGVRAANALVSYAAYIGKMLWPANLSALYAFSRPAGVVVFASFVLLAVITAAVMREARRRPYLAVGWLWYLGMLVPVIGLVHVGSQAMADRYTYVPMAGLFIMVGWGVPDLLVRVRRRKVVLAAAAGAALLAFTIAARAQVRYWKDSTTLWTHALAVNADNDIAHNLLGEELAKKGNLTDAVFHYTEALRINPQNAEAYNNLGLALADQGNLADGIAHYRQALRLKPRFVDAHYNLGLALATQGKTAGAVEEYSTALRINPEFIGAHNNLGVILAQQGKTDEARSHFMAVLRLTPDNPDAHNNLGILLASQGRIDEAAAHFSRAVRLRPDFEAARNNLKITRSSQAAGDK